MTQTAWDPLGRELGENVFRMTPPELHFPIGRVFQVHDEFNGNIRGTYYFRSIFNGRLRGPFLSSRVANITLQNDSDDGA